MAVLPTLTTGLPELSQNIWERYGFRGNPFNTQALSASAESILPIAQAIIGRGIESPESQLLTKYLNTLLAKKFIPLSPRRPAHSLSSQ
jgi:hypothetical protein